MSLNYLIERILLIVVLAIAPPTAFYLKKLVAKVELKPSRKYRLFLTKLFIITGVSIAIYSELGWTISVIIGAITLAIVILVKESLLNRYIYGAVSALAVAFSSMNTIHLNTMLCFTALLSSSITEKRTGINLQIKKAFIILVSGAVLILLRIAF